MGIHTVRIDYSLSFWDLMGFNQVNMTIILRIGIYHKIQSKIENIIIFKDVFFLIMIILLLRSLCCNNVVPNYFRYHHNN